MRTTAFPLALFAVLLAAGWERAQAAPQIDAGTTVTRKKGMPHAAISYSLSGEPAVVTIDVLVGGASAGAAARLCVTGDVNRLVQPGVHKAVLQTTGPLASVADKDVSVAVRAWATNCPPDYLVLSLTNRNEAARYYLTAELCRSAARKGISCASVHNDSFSGDTSGTLCKNSNGFRLWLPAHAEK